MVRVRLESGEWSSGEVALASTFRERRRGLKAAGVDSVLIETRSVHGIGMRGPFLAVGLGPDLEVRESRVVAPNRIAFFPGCRYVLEMAEAAPPPPIGSLLEMRRV